MTAPKRPGRPKLDPDDDQASASVHVTLSATDYDLTYQRAQLARISMPELIRRDLRARHSPAKKS